MWRTELLASERALEFSARIRGLASDAAGNCYVIQSGPAVTKSRPTDAAFEHINGVSIAPDQSALYTADPEARFFARHSRTMFACVSCVLLAGDTTVALGNGQEKWRAGSGAYAFVHSPNVFEFDDVAGRWVPVFHAFGVTATIAAAVGAGVVVLRIEHLSDVAADERIAALWRWVWLSHGQTDGQQKLWTMYGDELLCCTADTIMRQKMPGVITGVAIGGAVFVNASCVPRWSGSPVNLGLLQLLRLSLREQLLTDMAEAFAHLKILDLSSSLNGTNTADCRPFMCAALYSASEGERQQSAAARRVASERDFAWNASIAPSDRFSADAPAE